ncbi:MAG: 2-amino-4-hydroxy-6-hydroxymethyldihydropteridine diphosphokinase [Alphaproteobacteria bacterium]|nr:2-amino-4-hydroxy-6-hydroxymethyldihydropteridine diphosphokinase [Alphaproteobacteria bacterium]
MIFIALGGNLPFGAMPVPETLKAALRALPDYGVTLNKTSPFYHSRPVPICDQPWFINGVASCTTHLAPHDLLRALLSLEEKFGRVRCEKNAARTLDLDIIDYRGQIISDPLLDLPHPRLMTRAFVLLPLYDIAPEWKHPCTGEGIAQLVKALSVDDRANTLRL